MFANAEGKKKVILLSERRWNCRIRRRRRVEKMEVEIGVEQKRVFSWILSLVVAVHLERGFRSVPFPGKYGASWIVLFAGKGGVAQTDLVAGRCRVSHIHYLLLWECMSRDGSLGAWILWGFLGGMVQMLGGLAILRLSQILMSTSSSSWWIVALPPLAGLRVSAVPSLLVAS